jgi:hypothetical protein
MINFNELFSYKDGFIFWRKYVGGNSRLGAMAGWEDGKGYLQVRTKGKTYGVHRIIWSIHNGDIPEGVEIDHIDGDPMNNLIENLRLVDRTGNCRNMKIPRHNKSGVIGVSWCKRTSKWFASIRVDNKEIFLGRYVNISEAAEARKRAEVKFGFHENHGRVGK